MDGWESAWIDGLGFVISTFPWFSVRFSDPFVKIQLVHGLKLVKTKKTSFLRGTIDPFYNESFSFKVPQEELENASLVFTGRWCSRCWCTPGEPCSARCPRDRRRLGRVMCKTFMSGIQLPGLEFTYHLWPWPRPMDPQSIIVTNVDFEARFPGTSTQLPKSWAHCLASLSLRFFHL